MVGEESVVLREAGCPLRPPWHISPRATAQSRGQAGEGLGSAGRAGGEHWAGSPQSWEQAGHQPEEGRVGQPGEPRAWWGGGGLWKDRVKNTYSRLLGAKGRIKDITQEKTNVHCL